MDGMELAIRRRTFCGMAHLGHLKAEAARRSLSKLDDAASDAAKRPPPAPRSTGARSNTHTNPPSTPNHPVRLLHESTMAELYQEQQQAQDAQDRYSNDSSIPSRARNGSHAAVAGAARGSSVSSAASLRRLLEESEEQLSRALAQAEEAQMHVDAEQLEELGARVAAFSAASTALRASISSGSQLGGNSDRDVEESPALEPVAASMRRLSMSAPIVRGEVTASHALTANHFDTSRQRECQICFDKLDALQAHVCVSCCGSFCASCTRWYIEYKVLEGEVSQKKMVCPAPQCTQPLSEDMVEAFVSPETLIKYRTFLKNQKAGIRFCPRAGCCAILDEPTFSTSRRVKCSACQVESCMRCGGNFHKLAFCRRTEKRFGRWKKRHDVRSCPNCKAVIEKQGGCSHMKCFQCDQEFCWACLRPWGSHDETLCLPLAFLRSKSNKFGCWAPLRVVTKTAIVGVAAVVVVAGAGLAVVVLPPVLGYQLAKDSYRRGRYARTSYLQVVHADVYN